MIVYLAGAEQACQLCPYLVEQYRPYVLAAFGSTSAQLMEMKNSFSGFILDSGAFTYLGKNNIEKDWDKYIIDYAKFIRDWDIDNFFELDIDSVVGYDRVLELRCMLEQETGKRCIPVWHYERGKEEYLKMCSEYDYVAIGGLVRGPNSVEIQKRLPWFIAEARKRGAKLHALGYTKIDGLKRNHLYSVDSTSWIMSAIHGKAWAFENCIMRSVDKSGRRIKDMRALKINNFEAWCKFQNWALKKL